MAVATDGAGIADDHSEEKAPDGVGIEGTTLIDAETVVGRADAVAEMELPFCTTTAEERTWANSSNAAVMFVVGSSWMKGIAVSFCGVQLP